MPARVDSIEVIEKILIDEIMLIDDVPDHVKSQQRLSQGNRLGLVKLEVFL